MLHRVSGAEHRLLLSSSANAESAFGRLPRLTIGDTYTPLDWQNYTPS